jgi:hypothetical protein
MRWHGSTDSVTGWTPRTSTRALSVIEVVLTLIRLSPVPFVKRGNAAAVHDIDVDLGRADVLMPEEVLMAGTSWPRSRR